MQKNILQKKVTNYVNTAKGLKSKTKTVSGNISKSLLVALPVTGAFIGLPVSEANGQSFKHYTTNITLNSSTNLSVSADLNGPFGNIGFYISGGTFSFRQTNGVVVIAEGNPVKVKAFPSNANSAITTGNTGFIPPNGQQIPVDHFSGQFLVFKDANRIGWMKIEILGSNLIIDEYAYTDQNTITLGQTALPVELTSFVATMHENGVRLNWQTATEENNAGFEVQRSKDGKNFETLDFVEGHGTTLEEQEYFYDDKALRQNQEYYYRLKQIDYDGKFEYSDVITARLESTTGQVGHFYPNPSVDGVTQLDYTATTNTELSVMVYNTTGQVLVQETRQINAGGNNLAFDFSDLPKGNYFVKLQAGEDTKYQKLVIN